MYDREFEILQLNKDLIKDLNFEKMASEELVLSDDWYHILDIFKELKINPLYYMENIPTNFFGDYYGLNGKISIPSHIKSIGRYAFRNCDNITDVDLDYNSNLESIGFGAFRDCDRLTTVFAFNTNLKYIDQGAFNFCKNLTYISLPESLLRIDKLAFNKCESLDHIALASGIEYIGINAFHKCSKLNKIFTDINDNTFKNLKCDDYNILDIDIYDWETSKPTGKKLKEFLK